MAGSAGKSPVADPGAAPGGATLNAWSEHDWRDEVNVEQLAPFDRIVATTRNHEYEIVVTSPGDAEVLVRGGQFLPEFTRARLAGSSLGGSFIKVHSVNVGFRLEILLEGRGPLVTTRVRSVRVVPGAGRAETM